MLKKIFGQFTCCNSTDHIEVDDEIQNEQMRKFNLLIKNNIIDFDTNDEEEFDHYNFHLVKNKNLLTDVKLLSKVEKSRENLLFTKEGILDFFKDLDDSEDFEFLYTKGNLILNCNKKGTKFAKDFYVGKSEFKMNKSKFMSEDGKTCLISLDHFKMLMYDPESRLSWDKSVKNSQVFKENLEDLKLTENCHLVYNRYPSPIFFISERDVLEKRIYFYHNGVYYDYTSSIDEENTPVFLKCDSSVVRVKSYLNLYSMWENEEFFYFKSYNQVDMKIFLPESFFNMLVPFKVLNFYTLLEEETNKLCDKFRSENKIKNKII